MNLVCAIQLARAYGVRPAGKTDVARLEWESSRSVMAQSLLYQLGRRIESTNGPDAGISYFSLSGTSQATPVVTGAVALMLQANPTLTPNAGQSHP